MIARVFDYVIVFLNKKEVERTERWKDYATHI